MRQTLGILIILLFALTACNFPSQAAPVVTFTPEASPTTAVKIQLTPSAVAPTPTPIIFTPTPSPEIRFYTVLKGETLSGIAVKLGIDMYGLARANYLTDPYWIYDGQQLLVATEPITVAKPTLKLGKQIEVILSQQKVYAFENGVLLKEFLVSTGVAAFPTVVGEYATYVKLESTTMSGPGYNLPGVPFTMYFYQGYGLHGTYWHSNFGHPMSHGCVNTYTPDAQWLFNWAPLGTSVVVFP